MRFVNPPAAKWRILRIDEKTNIDWRGEFLTAEEALEALRLECEKEKPLSRLWRFRERASRREHEMAKVPMQRYPAGAKIRTGLEEPPERRLRAGLPAPH
jgi:hypothetical protein